MRVFLQILFTVPVIWLASCANSQTDKPAKYSLLPTEFADKMANLPDAPLIDVRTPREFAQGALANAININWNDTGFEEKINNYDKNKPVLIYCLGGGRISEAAAMMRQAGFREVYEMQGGLMKWNAAGLGDNSKDTQQGMTKTEYDQLLLSDKPVLIDFYAEWCVPCKKMKPFLEEISNEMPDKITVIRIDADKNKALCKEMKVESLPVLILYKNGEVIWTKNAFADKEEIIKAINGLQ